MEKETRKKAIMECVERLSKYGIKLENHMRTLRVTSRCVPQAKDMEADDPLEHFLFDGRHEKYGGRGREGVGLLWTLRYCGCLTDVDYVPDPEYRDKEYVTYRDEPVCDEPDSVAWDIEIEMDEPEYFPDSENLNANSVMGISFGFTAVEEVVVDEDNPYFSSRDGVLFDKDMTRLIWYPYGKQNETYSIPDGVREIGPWAFAGKPQEIPVRRKDGSIVKNKHYTKYVFNRSLIQVILPDTVTVIRDNAFNHCLFLTSVRLSSNLKEILWSAFHGCKALWEIQLPDSLEYIEQAFAGCDNMKKLRFLGTRHQISRAWKTYSNSEFTTYYGPVPYSPEFVPRLFGKYGESDQMPVVSFEKKWFTIIDGVMFNQDRTELIWCDRGKRGAYTVPDTVIRIGEMAFMDCGELTQIEISHPGTVIEKRGFFRCGKLEQVVFRDSGSVKYIAAYAFQCCERLRKAPLTGAESIGDFAFFACKSLRGARVPQSCGHIGEKAFNACNALESLSVPKSLAGFKYNRWDGNKNTYRDFEASRY